MTLFYEQTSIMEPLLMLTTFLFSPAFFILKFHAQNYRGLFILFNFVGMTDTTKIILSCFLFPSINPSGNFHITYTLLLFIK